MLDLWKDPTFDFRTHKVHYFSLKNYGFDGEIKNFLIRYIHFVNGRMINHIKLLRTDKSKPHNFLTINHTIKSHSLCCFLLSVATLSSFLSLWCPLLFLFFLLIWLRKRRIKHRKHHLHPLSTVFSRSIHFYSLRDLSCKKLKENKWEKSMNEKKKKAKKIIFRLWKNKKLKV